MKTLRRQLRHWFLPHNDHRPHLIRAHGLAVLAVTMIGIQLLANTVRPADVRVLAYAVNITPVDLLAQTNQQRVANGLSALRLDSRLNNSAQLKAQNMFSEDYWAHVSPSGIQPWYWFNQTGYNYSYAGENLAKDFDTTSGTITGWMNSPGHRANILNANYTDVGFSVMNGTLQGEQTTLVVAHYGHEAASTSVVAAVVAPRVTPIPARTFVPTSTPVIALTTPATPSPTSKVTPKPIVAIVTNGDIHEAAPAARSYSLFRPLSLTRTLNWSNLITFVLLTILLLVYSATHMTVWRKGLKRWRRRGYRNVAFLQVGGLVIILTIIAVSSFGHVG
jgi:hypothetical protein